MAAEEEGAKFVFLAAPHRVIGDNKGNVQGIEVVKTRPGEYDTSGRRKPVLTDEIQRFECDVGNLRRRRDRGPWISSRASGLTLERERHVRGEPLHAGDKPPSFYAGGDVVTGASNVSNAMAYGKQAARKHRPAIDGSRPLGAACSRKLSTPDEPPQSPAHIVATPGW